MFKLIFSRAFAEWLTASLVIMLGAIIGRQAAIGMDGSQWLSAALVMASAILLAVLVWTPEPQRKRADQRESN